MTKNTLHKLLKYLDCFGTTFTFYNEGSRKLYTPLGGILTILSIIFSIVIFINIKLEEFLHNNPTSITSTKRQNYRNITFREEKIWIPWRVRDFGGKTVNHTNFLYPIIYYYKGIRNYELKRMDVTYEFINYKLCSETSMVNYTNLYGLDIELEDLYCIDMEDLNIGGSWDSDFLNLITLDIYTCKNGIDYDENNTDCTTYEEIADLAGSNDCFEFEMYYPIVQYEPNNKKTPLFIKYYNYFYHFSRFSNKIDRLYLEEHILYDDTGLIIKNEVKTSHWGCASLSGDSYTTGEERDLMNEGSSSRLYSFNIYLKPEVIIYRRSFKKLYLIIADGLPIINVIFIIFEMIAEFFGMASGNKKLTESLFENLKKNKIHINQQFKNLKLDTNKIYINKRKYLTTKNVFKTNLKNKNINDNSSIHLSDNLIKSICLSNVAKNNSIDSFDNINKSKILLKSNDSNQNYKLFKKFSNDNPKNFRNISINNEGELSIKSNDLSLNERKYIKKKNKSNEKIKKYTSNSRSDVLESESGFIKNILFPYRYYLCSIFIKHGDISTNSLFFTKKFMTVYNFMCELFDISSYLIMQKEFEILKSTLLVGKYRDILDNNQKINVNKLNFNVNMKEYSNTKKFFFNIRQNK